MARLTLGAGVSAPLLAASSHTSPYFSPSMRPLSLDRSPPPNMPSYRRLRCVERVAAEPVLHVHEHVLQRAGRARERFLQLLLPRGGLCAVGIRVHPDRGVLL